MQTALVAGGAGFIGSHLCKKLMGDGYKVICIDNFITGNKRNVEELLSNSAFQLIDQDIVKIGSDFNTGSEDLKFIFHLASPASPNTKSPRSYISFPVETLLVNSVGTYNLLELAKKHNARFLYASSSEIYGDPEISPQKEDYFGNVNPNGVRSVYDEGKRFGEAMTMAFFRKHGLDTRIVRIFNTYGPQMLPDDGRVVSNFIMEAINNKPITVYGDGSQTRSFCYVSDMIEGISKLMFEDSAKGEVMNLGNPDERSIVDLAHFIKELTKSRSEIVFGDLPQDDPKVRKPDISKAENILSWKPRVILNEGLKKTIEYFKTV